MISPGLKTDGFETMQTSNGKIQATRTLTIDKNASADRQCGKSYALGWKCVGLLGIVLLLSIPAEGKLVHKLRYSTADCGPIQLYFDDIGNAKLSSLFGVIVVSPNGSSTSFNDSSKVYFKYASPAEFTTGGFYKSHLLMHSPDRDFMPWTKISARNSEGISIVTYKRSLKDDSKNLAKYGSKNVKEFAEIVTATQSIPCPYSWATLYFTALGSPCPSKCLPLTFQMIGGEKVSNRLNVIKISKEDVDEHFFDTPTGYKLVRSDLEVFVQGSGLDEMFYRTR